MGETVDKSQKCIRYFIYILMIAFAVVSVSSKVNVTCQSIGYQPLFNFGFNPYYSPVFGYGLGLPFGANNISPARYPSLLNSVAMPPFIDKTGLMSKIHAKALLKKLATSQILAPGYNGLKDKLNLIKHPEYAYTPYGASYGYGKHYGAAVVPNNPYKSTSPDFYEYDGQPSNSKPSLTEPAMVNTIPIGGKPTLGNLVSVARPYSHYLKPLIKAGALITTAAILGKKVFEVPIRLAPSGMILNDIRP